MNFMSSFQEGDVVKLKSGGPAMTIAMIHNNEDKTAYVRWYNEPESKIDGAIIELITVEKIN
jgi:uncharacterized protein YodC (DUF2158 family)